MKIMLKKIQLILVLLFSIIVNGQIGIKTTKPQQTIHIAGETETVRVDGLSETNNVNNIGNGATSRVHIDAKGDMVLGTATENIEILIDYENYLEDVEDSTTLVNQTSNTLGYFTAGTPIDGMAASFTLTKNAIVEVNYSVSWSVYKNTSPTGRIADEHARIVQTGLYFRYNDYLGSAVINDVDGNPINGGAYCIDVNSSGTVCQETGGLLAINSQFYNNGDAKNGEYRDFHNTGSDYVKLGPGTYCVMFAAQLAVGDTGGTGDVKMYLGSGNDDLQVIAHYYN